MKKALFLFSLFIGLCSSSFAAEVVNNNINGVLSLSIYSLSSSQKEAIPDIYNLNYQQLNDKLIKLGYSVSHDNNKMTETQFLYKRVESQDQILDVPKTLNRGYTIIISNVESIGTEYLFDYSSTYREVSKRYYSLLNENSVQSPSVFSNSYEKYNVWLNENNHYIYFDTTQNKNLDGQWTTKIIVVSKR